jgi:hypothetical protein
MRGGSAYLSRLATRVVTPAIAPAPVLFRSESAPFGLAPPAFATASFAVHADRREPVAPALDSRETTMQSLVPALPEPAPPTADAAPVPAARALAPPPPASRSAPPASRFETSSQPVSADPVPQALAMPAALPDQPTIAMRGQPPPEEIRRPRRAAAIDSSRPRAEPSRDVVSPPPMADRAMAPPGSAPAPWLQRRPNPATEAPVAMPVDSVAVPTVAVPKVSRARPGAGPTSQMPQEARPQPPQQPGMQPLEMPQRLAVPRLAQAGQPQQRVSSGGVTIGRVDVRVTAPPPPPPPQQRQRTPVTAPVRLARGFPTFGLAQG